MADKDKAGQKIFIPFSVVEGLSKIKPGDSTTLTLRLRAPSEDDEEAEIEGLEFEIQSANMSDKNVAPVTNQGGSSHLAGTGGS